MFYIILQSFLSHNQVEFEQSTKERIGLSTNFSSTISADSEPGTIYPGTHAVTCKHR